MKYICCCFVLVYCLLLCPATVTAGDTTSFEGTGGAYLSG